MTDKNTPVPELPLTRGCMVTYEGTGHTTVYYFQPNGNSCYLYENKEDVGNKEKAVFTPGIYSVRTIDPAVGLRWLEERREHQAKLKHVQQLLLHQGLVRSKTTGLVYTTKGQEQQASSPHFHCVNLLEPMEHEMSDLEILTEETAPEHYRTFARRQERFEKKALVHYKAGQVVWYHGEPWFFGVYLKYSPRATLYRESKGKEEVATATVLLGEITLQAPKGRGMLHLGEPPLFSGQFYEELPTEALFAALSLPPEEVFTAASLRSIRSASSFLSDKK